MPSSATFPKRAMILAAGLGTRLKPLTDELPKPLMWIGDRPMLAHIVERLAGAGVERVVINTHHLAPSFSSESLSGLPIPVDVAHERTIRGTGGGISGASRLLGDEGDVIVWNGDILADVDLRGLVEAHQRSRALATLAVGLRPASEGPVGLGDGGLVVRLREERTGHEAFGADFLGVQVVSAGMRRRLPEVGCLVGDGYIPALSRGERIASFVVREAWDDIGSVPSYVRANMRWLANTTARAYVGEGAVVDEAVDVTGSVVGAGARVMGRGPLRRCVIWPGAQVMAPLEGAVVTSRGTLVRG